MACPRCASEQVRKNGKDRRGTQVYSCRACRRSFTPLTETPFAHHGFPLDMIALAVRWYLRYRLSYADLAELLAERGVEVHRSTIYLWVQRFTPLYQEVARPHRHRIGTTWHTDETYVKVGKRWRYVYRAIDEQGQVIDVYVSERRDAEAAATFFRQALQSTGCRPGVVTTDKARAYPPALAQVLPDVLHLAGKAEQQTIERDHQHLKGRIRSMRSFKTDPTAQVVCAGHSFMRNLGQGFYNLSGTHEETDIPCLPRLMHAWNQLTTQLLSA
ncbi:MAG: IS6 family transposase [Chloroflexota bacterium]